MDRSSSASSQHSQTQSQQQKQQQQSNQQHQSRHDLFLAEKRHQNASEDSNDSVNDGTSRGGSLKFCSSSASSSARNTTNDVSPTPPIRVRDMIRRYDIAASLVQSKPPAVATSRSFFFGNSGNRNNNNNSNNKENVSRMNSKLPPKTATAAAAETAAAAVMPDMTTAVASSSSSSSNHQNNGIDRSVSSTLQNTMRQIRSRNPTQSEPQLDPPKLRNQSSFINLSRMNEVNPKNIPSSREKRRRHTSIPNLEEKADSVKPIPVETSYQSKTTIAKTPCGVRIIIDIFFEPNQSLAMSDVVGSRVETDIPPSKILSEFQKRALTLSRN